MVNALNNQDQIVGMVLDSSYKRKAALWNSNGTLTNVGIVFGSLASVLKDINDEGITVGYVIAGSSLEVFIRATDGEIQYPDIFLNNEYSGLYINNSGQISGFSTEGLFLWDDDNGLRLLTLPEGLVTITIGQENLKIIDLTESGQVIAAFNYNGQDGFSVSGTYAWTDPNHPEKLDSRRLVDLNIHNQKILEGDLFYDSQYLYNHMGNDYNRFLPFQTLVPNGNGVSYWQLIFRKINDQGQILTMGREPYISCLWEPKRIVFEDLFLLDAITEELELTREPNYMDVLEMTHLDARARGIQSLAGLEYAFHLESLDIRDNPLDKRSICYTLEVLKRHNADIVIRYDNHLYNDCAVEFEDPTLKQKVEQVLDRPDPNYFDVLAEWVFSLTVSDVNNLGGIENLVYLTALDLERGTFSDLSGLSELYRLDDLEISENPNLSDIAPLENLSYLKKLNLSGCSVSNIRPLLELHYLRELNLEDNPIDPIMVCEVLPQIHENNQSLSWIFIEPLPHFIRRCSSDLSSIESLMHDWLKDDCSDDNRWCDQSDINKDGRINLIEMSYIAAFWMHENVYW